MKRRIFIKELLPTGKLVQGGKEWNITKTFIDNCVEQFHDMKMHERPVNVHSEHEHTPETKLGVIEDMWADYDHKGRYALFSKLKFLDHLPDEKIDTFATCDVSVEIPSVLTTPEGHKWTKPVQRVAVTADPAISGMLPFLRLSLNADTQEKPMNPEEQEGVPQGEPEMVPQEGADDGGEAVDESALLQTLVQVLGIDINQFESDEQLIQAIGEQLAQLLQLKMQLDSGGGGGQAAGALPEQGGAPEEAGYAPEQQEQPLVASLNTSIRQYREELILSMNLPKPLQDRSVSMAHRIPTADTAAFNDFYQTLKLSLNQGGSQRTGAQIPQTPKADQLAANLWTDVAKARR